MKVAKHYITKFRFKLNLVANRLMIINTLPLALAACGGGSKEEVKGFPTSYVPPKADYNAPNVDDPYSEILNKPYEAPYWVQALEMNQSENHIFPILSTHNRVIQYSFPDKEPAYDLHFITGWQPATDAMKIASRQIFLKLNTILDVSFIEGIEPSATNVIAISRSAQTTTAGISYFPNNYFEIGIENVGPTECKSISCSVVCGLEPNHWLIRPFLIILRSIAINSCYIFLTFTSCY